MNEEALKALYEDVSLSYEVGTLDDFKAYLSDSQKRELFFNQVIQPEYDVQSIDDFELAYGLKKKDESDSISQEVVTESVTPTEEEEVISSDISETLSPQEESEFQNWMATDPNVVAWREEFKQNYGEEPQIDNSNYDYRGAWKAGLKPEPSEVDGMYHWGSKGIDGVDLKSKDHPTRWKSDYMELTGVNPDESGITKQEALEVISKSVQTDLDVEPIKVGFEEEPEVPAEKLTAIERTFGKNAFTDFFGDMYRAGVQGQTQGGTLDEAMTLFSGGADVSDEQIEEFIRANEELANVPPSDEMQDFQKIYENNGGGVLGFILGVAKNPTVVPQLFVSSVSAMANPTSAKYALATGTAGAGIGTVVPIIGTATGALGGLMAGAGGALETGLTFAELLQEEVDGELTKESIRKVLEDEEAYNRIRNKSLARGLTIAAVEGLSGGLAGKVTSKVVGATGRKLAGTAAGIGVESVGGSVGEVAGRLAAGQEMDVAEIGFEGIAGTATAPLSVGYGLYKAPKYSINKSRNGELATVSGPDMAKFIRTATPEQILKAEVTIENDSELQKIYDDKFKEASVENDIQQADPSMNEPTRKAITKLQLQLNELQGNESQVAKDKATQLRAEIKNLQENPITEGEARETVTTVEGDDVSTTTNIVTEEFAAQKLAEEGIQNPTPEQVSEKQQQLLKQQADAIQEPSTETVDVQEQAGVSETVGVRDTEVIEPTTEVAQEEVQEQVIPEDVREEIEKFEADENIDLSELDAIAPTEEEVAPEFRRKTINTLTESQNTEQDIKEAEILETLNQRADNVVNVSEITETEATPSQIDVQSLNERTGGNFQEFDINTLDDVPVMWNISDQLTTGNYNPNVTDVNQNYSVTNPLTGNQITNLKGGLGFSSVKGHENIAWASVTQDKVDGQINSAKKIYEQNKAKFDKLWADGKLPDGHIPMVVVKMGNDSMKSNEAMIRVIKDNLASFPAKNKKSALKALKEELSIIKERYQKVLDSGLTSKGKKATGITLKNYAKFISEIQDVQDMIKQAKPKSIEDVLSTENLKSLKGISSVVQITNLITSGNFDVLKTEPTKSKKPVIKALYGDNPSQQDINKFNTKKIADVITEPELANVPQRSAFMVTSIDIKNPQTVRTSHPNYPVGPKGKVLGILKQPISIVDLVPAAYNNVALGIAQEVTGETKARTDKARLVQAVPVQAGLSNRELLGTPIGINTDRRLVDFINRSFPNTNIVVDVDTFNEVMNREGVKEYLKDGDVIYGVTVNGEIFINPEVHNTKSALFNTAIHEMGHVWTKYLQLSPKGKKIYNAGIELVKQTDVYKEQLEIFDGDVAKAAEEAMAILIGNKGESITNQAIKSKWVDWLVGLYDYIKSQFKLSKDLKASDIENMTLDQFLGTALADIFKGEEIKTTPKQREQMMADAEFRGVNKKKIVSDFVKKARGLGYSDAAITTLLQGKGVEADLISEIVTTEKKAAPKAKVTEDVVPGFDRLKKEIDGIIQKSKDRGVKFNKIIDNVIKYVEGSRVYETATDNVREQLIRDIRKEFKLNEKTSPSVGKILGAINNVKKVSIRESEILKLRMQEAIKAAKGAKDFAKTFKNQIANDLYALVNKGQITQKQAVAIAKRLAQVDVDSQKSIDKFTDYVSKVFSESTDKYINSVIKDIAAFVKEKSEKAKTVSNKARSKGLDAQGQAFFQAANNILSAILSNKFNAQLIEDKFFPDIESILSKEGDLTVKEQAQLDAFTAFDLFSGIENMSVQEVEQLLQDLKNERTESISRLKDKIAKEKAELKELRDEADSNIQEGYSELFNDDGTPLNEDQRKGKKDSIRKAIFTSKFMNSIMEYAKKYNPSEPGSYLNAISNNLKNLATLTNSLDKVGKFFTENVYNQLNRMESNYVKGLQKTRKKLDDIAKSIDGIESYNDIKKKLGSGVHTIKGITTGEGKTLFTDSFNADQLMRVYALSKNPIQRAKLLKQGFTDAKIEEIKKILGPEVVEFTDKVVDYLSTEYFEQTNDVYKDVNNVNLGFVENYFPTQTIQTKVDAKLLKDGDFSGVFNSQVAPALKERVDQTGDIKILSADFTSVIDNHFETIERYKAYAKGVKTLNSLFSFNSVSTLLDETGMSMVVRNAVNFAVNPNGGEQAIKPTLIDKLMTKYTGFALAFKAVQIIKQATSFINAYEDYSYRGPGKKKIPGLDLAMFMIDHAVNIATLPIAIREMYNTSPMVRERLRQGLEGDVYGLESGSVTFKPLKKQSGLLGRAIRGFKTAAGFPTVAGDILGVMGYWANYKRDIANGMSKEKALEKFENYNATQQSRRPTDKIPLQMNSNAYTRAFTMFGSTLFLQINKVMQSYTNIMRSASKGKIPSVKDSRALMLNLGAANVLFQLTANAFKYGKGDEEDKEEVVRIMKDAMSGLNLIYQVPFFGAAVESMVNKARGTRRPVDVAVNPLTSVISKAKKIAKDDKPVEAIVRTATELTIGAQADPFIGLYNGFSEGFDDEVMYDVLGVSSSYRPSDNTPTKSESLKQLKEFNPKAYEKLMKQQEKEKLKKQKLKEKMERKSK